MYLRISFSGSGEFCRRIVMTGGREGKANSEIRRSRGVGLVGFRDDEWG